MNLNGDITALSLKVNILEIWILRIGKKKNIHNAVIVVSFLIWHPYFKDVHFCCPIIFSHYHAVFIETFN